MSMLYNQFFALRADHEIKTDIARMTVTDVTTGEIFKMGYEFGTLFVKGV